MGQEIHSIQRVTLKIVLIAVYAISLSVLQRASILYIHLSGNRISFLLTRQQMISVLSNYLLYGLLNNKSTKVAGTKIPLSFAY